MIPKFVYLPKNYRAIQEYKEKYPFGTLVNTVFYYDKIVGEYSFDVIDNERFQESYSVPLDILFLEKKGKKATARELIYFGKKYAKMGFYVVYGKYIGFGEHKDDFENFIKSEFSINQDILRLYAFELKMKMSKAPINQNMLQGICEDIKKTRKPVNESLQSR